MDRPSLIQTYNLNDAIFAASYNERLIRWLLEQWVSGLSPAVARGPDGEILGLCDADAAIGSKPFIFAPHLITK